MSSIDLTKDSLSYTHRITTAHAGKAINFMKMILSDKETTNHFHNVVKPLFNQIILNTKENQNLTQIRDSLLPRLMSGKIRVPVEVRT